jgi:hypothetical protein
MRFLKLSALMGFVAFLMMGNYPRTTPTCRDIIGAMLDSVKNIRTQKCDIKVVEHINDHLNVAESQIKINTSPKKIYYKSILKGNEVLWIQGENKGNARIHASSVPLLNLDLDPYGSIMRKDNHHTIFDLGFQYIASIVANTIVRYPKEFDKHFTYAGSIVWNKTDCYQIAINFPEYKYIEYAVSKGETASSIAEKFSTSDYKIRRKNNLSSYYGTIKEGKKLMVPSPYGNKVIIYIDKKNGMPINVKVYDEEGLFEAYEFTNVKINFMFAPDEFSEKFKGYNF